MSDTPNLPRVIEHAPLATREELHPLVALAMRQDGTMDPGALEKLMDLQERHEATLAKRSYTKARIALDSAMPRIIGRDASASFDGKNIAFTYATLANILDKIVPVLNEYGFTLTYTSRITDNADVIVTCVLTHADGHSEECTMKGQPDTKGSKSQPQGVASTMTLLRRHTAMALLNLATADMEEPPADPKDDDVDPERNLRAVAKMLTLGKTKAEAEAFAGRSVDRWTIGDLKRLQAWAKPRSQE